MIELDELRSMIREVDEIRLCYWLKGLYDRYGDSTIGLVETMATRYLKTKEVAKLWAGAYALWLKE